MQRLGAIRIDELIVPITEMKLVRGGLEVRAIVHGPCDVVQGNMRIFTADGEPVTEGAIDGCEVIIVPLRKGDSLILNYTLNFMRPAS